MKNVLRGSINFPLRTFGIVAVGVAVLAVGYIYALLEQKKALQPKIYVPPVTMATPAPTEEPPVTVFPASMEDATLRSYAVTKLPDTTYISYSITYPASWELRLSESTYHRTLSLWKDAEYEIRIYQAAVGGGWCVFEGEVPKGVYGDFRNIPFVQIESEVGSLRRYKTSSKYSHRENVTSFTFCHKDNRKKNQYTDYSEPTVVGGISYTVPENFEQKTINEMDEIIKTVKEI